MNKTELITLNINFANKIAAHKKSRISCVHFEELQSAAFLGLVEAANGYDSEKNNCFLAYAYIRINGAIKDYLREIRWGSRRIPIKTHAIEKVEFAV